MSAHPRRENPQTIPELVSEGEQLTDGLHLKKAEQLDEYARRQLDDGHPQEAFVFFEMSRNC